MYNEIEELEYLREELEYLREMKHKLLFAIIKGIGIIGALYFVDFITN